MNPRHRVSGGWPVEPCNHESTTWSLRLLMPRHHSQIALFRPRTLTRLLLLFPLLVPLYAAEQQSTAPTIGQEGKDVPWVPTPDILVDKMLEMAAVSTGDVVIDLGSGDGRTVIAAARLGARAVGVELEENLVAVSKRRADEEDLSDRTEFHAMDLFEFDLSPATVVTMFLLPDLNYRLRPSLLKLSPGTRIVSNTWDLGGVEGDPDAPGWLPDETVVLDPCPTWCTSLLWIVPARVEGTWQLGEAKMELEQQFQAVTGRLHLSNGRIAIEQGVLRGAKLTFRADGTQYSGNVEGPTIRGTARTAEGNSVSWEATRLR